MRYLLLVCTFCTVATAHAAPAAWDCTLHAQLSGNGDFYLRYGRDSWHGSGTLICQAAGQTASREVEIGYNGYDAGYGINETSLLTVDVTLATSVALRNVYVYGYVNSDLSGPLYHWHFESENYFLDAQVSTGMLNLPIGTSSLRRGLLFIR